MRWTIKEFVKEWVEEYKRSLILGRGTLIVEFVEMRWRRIR